MSTHGIHHVTAVTADIVRNRQFYTGTLGLRLVKRSVNQDDVKAYHLFYADAVGTPGTDMTFFDWPTSGQNLPGPGTVALTTFRVPSGALEYWRERLSAEGLYVEEDEDGVGRPRIVFSDAEGQRLALVDDKGLRVDATPFTDLVPESSAIRGILGVDIESARPDGTHRVLTDILGFEAVTRDESPTYRAGIGEIRLHAPSNRRLGSVGAGGVHHVAVRARDDEHLREMQEKVESAGLRTSGYIDRFWFHSVYFREPGGVLFELATDGPGFGADEAVAHLGEKLVLPPFLEGRRSEIEAGLKPID